MKPFGVMFEETKSETIVYNGHTIYRRLKFSGYPYIKLEISNISTNSKYKQAIVVLFSSDFTGKVLVDGKLFDVHRGLFSKICFWEDDIPLNFVLECYTETGFFSICNGMDIIGTKEFCKMLNGGCAMIVDDVAQDYSTKTREYFVHCNDFENDDDFDDIHFLIKQSE